MYTDRKRNAKRIRFTVGDQVLAKNVNPTNKLNSFYERDPYTVVETYERSCKIKNHKGRFVRINSHLKVFDIDKTKPIKETDISKRGEKSEIEIIKSNRNIIIETNIEPNSQTNINTQAEQQIPNNPYLNTQLQKRTHKKPQRLIEEK